MKTYPYYRDWEICIFKDAIPLVYNLGYRFEARKGKNIEDASFGIILSEPGFDSEEQALLEAKKRANLFDMGIYKVSGYEGPKIIVHRHFKTAMEPI